jgi:hypothetical protein
MMYLVDRRIKLRRLVIDRIRMKDTNTTSVYHILCHNASFTLSNNDAGLEVGKRHSHPNRFVKRVI